MCVFVCFFRDVLHRLPLPLSSCLGCIPPLIGLPSLCFYAVASSLFLCFCCLYVYVCVFYFIATMSFAGYFLVRSLLSAFPAYLRFPVELVWFRLSCDHGWIRSGSVNVKKTTTTTTAVMKKSNTTYSFVFLSRYVLSCMGIPARS